MDNYVITIARGFGSGGKMIGEQVAKELGIPCYEYQLLKMASDQSGIHESLFARVDEKLRGSYVVNQLKKIPYPTTITPASSAFISDINLFNIQSDIIRELAKTESCVIIGKCADYILRSYPNVVSFYIQAPKEVCVETVMEKMHVGKSEAARLIARTDKYRSDYYKFYTGGGKWTDSTNYDLVLNSYRIGWENCVELIKSYTKLKLL
ncbi:MAG: cytidylate kinase-like family protein [Clostridia bacterium]|jgi:cytidylate kinase|nr:cytidylate kinase-like family protein [Clostridia bacterium]